MGLFGIRGIASRNRVVGRKVQWRARERKCTYACMILIDAMAFSRIRSFGYLSSEVFLF